MRSSAAALHEASDCTIGDRWQLLIDKSLQTLFGHAVDVAGEKLFKAPIDNLVDPRGQLLTQQLGEHLLQQRLQQGPELVLHLSLKERRELRGHERVKGGCVQRLRRRRRAWSGGCVCDLREETTHDGCRDRG